jgi:hypothetical protein
LLFSQATYLATILSIATKLQAPSPAPHHLPAIVGRGDFYLGFHIEREVYGWLRLRPIDGMPTLAGSEFASHPIVVGVSEPAA